MNKMRYNKSSHIRCRCKNFNESNHFPNYLFSNKVMHDKISNEYIYLFF